jgi:hypothetical protein
MNTPSNISLDTDTELESNDNLNWITKNEISSIVSAFEEEAALLCFGDWALYLKTHWNFIEAVDNTNCKRHCINKSSIAICWRGSNCSNYNFADNVSRIVSSYYSERNLEEATDSIY